MIKNGDAKCNYVLLRSLGGPSAALRSAALGAVLLALIEGIGIGITRMTAEQFKPGLFSEFFNAKALYKCSKMSFLSFKMWNSSVTFTVPFSNQEYEWYQQIVREA